MSNRYYVTPNLEVRERQHKDGYICSICHLEKPLSSYCKEDSTTRSRTNCFECYNLPYEEMKNLDARNKEIIKSVAFKQFLENVSAYEIFSSIGINAHELAKKLLELPEGSRVCVTQDGYYSDGLFASCFHPQFVGEENRIPKIEGLPEITDLFTIGHSSQNY